MLWFYPFSQQPVFNSLFSLRVVVSRKRGELRIQDESAFPVRLFSNLLHNEQGDKQPELLVPAFPYPLKLNQSQKQEKQDAPDNSGQNPFYGLDRMENDIQDN